MNPRRWRRIEKIFAQAIELEGEARSRWLEDSCADDPDLKMEVEALLAADGQGQDLLTATLRREAATFLAETEAAAETTTMVGRRVGAWLVERRIGEGGLSTVYLARRADEQFNKQVALKLIRRETATEDVLRHFQQEKSILASLEHPNIARILDAGLTDNGQPFLVMEHVDGTHVDQYCDTRRASVRERLKLFLEVCATVSHAHQNLIIHRDLKPSNILVTREGIPKLLDFGIASWLQPRAEAAAGEMPPAPEASKSTHRLLTPGYASPEQLSGESVTMASDVYSLGLLLHQLLSGRRLDRTRQAMFAPSRAIYELPRNRPSHEPEQVAELRSTTPKRLRNQLAGDLDSIVLKALREEPSQRYSTVDALARDLRCHLEGWPVAARPNDFSYRASKFLRRHRAATAAAAAAIVLVLAFVVTLTIQSMRIARERDISEKERLAAERVSELLIDVFHVSEAGGDTITAREVLDREASRVTDELDEEPEIQASLMLAIGRVYKGLGLYDQAVPFLRRSVELRRKIFPSGHPAVAVSLNHLAMVYGELGSYEQAEPLFREAYEMRFELFGPEHTAVNSSLNNLALVNHELGDFRAAEPLYREVVAMDQKLLGRQHPDVCYSLVNLAFLLVDLGDYAEAEEHLRRVVDLQREFFGPNHSELARSMSHLGSALSSQGQFGAAETLLRQAEAMHGELLGAKHPQLARTRYALAMHLLRHGQYAESARLHRWTLDLRLEILGPEHPEVATSIAGLAQALAAKGDSQAAEPLFSRALELHRLKLPPRHPEIAVALCGLGRLWLAAGETDRARPLFEEALTIRRQVLRPGDPRIEETEALLAQSSPKIS